MMRASIAAAPVVILTIALGPAFMSAQTARRSTAPAKTAVPRAADGKPDLTGVWQGGSTQRGTWEEANRGVGVGGSGRDPAAPARLGSRPPL